MKDDRIQVNLRLDRHLVDELDDAARSEGGDRTELARRLLSEGLVRHRVEHALRDYAAGRVSASGAAERAGISLYEMLDRIHEARIPYELDPTALERIDALLAAGRSRGAAAGRPRPVSEEPAGWDTETAIRALRERYRPSSVRLLFVGESSPAGGTHFYRANSNLFRATREAFVAAFGPAVPDGDAFLGYFSDLGCWLVDVAERPVNRMRGRPRRDAVEAGVRTLAGLIRQTRPERIVAVKASVEPALRRAAREAGFDGAISVLPFPVRQWRRPYIRQLSELLAQTFPDH
jgi:hypothetical protein